MQRQVILTKGQDLEANGDIFIPLPELVLPEKGGNNRLSGTIVKPACRKRGRKLNEKEARQQFCYLYATRGDLTVKECAFKAGYAAAHTGTRLLKDPAVLAMIEEIRSSGVPIIERLPLRERQKRWYELFLKRYNEKRLQLRQELGSAYRDMLDGRNDKTLYSKKERKEGHLAEFIHHKEATAYATKLCNEQYGELKTIPTKWDKYQKRWKPRYVRGVIRL